MINEINKSVLGVVLIVGGIMAIYVWVNALQLIWHLHFPDETSLPKDWVIVYNGSVYKWIDDDDNMSFKDYKTKYAAIKGAIEFKRLAYPTGTLKLNDKLHQQVDNWVVVGEGGGSE